MHYNTVFHNLQHIAPEFYTLHHIAPEFHDFKHIAPYFYTASSYLLRVSHLAMHCFYTLQPIAPELQILLCITDRLPIGVGD